MTNVLQEIVDEQRAHIAQLVSRIEELTLELAETQDERRHAVAALSEQVDTARAERDEVRQSYCSLMEAYRGGNGRVTANKLGWGYLFEKENKENTND